MTQNEVDELVQNSIERLREFNTLAKSNINKLSKHEYYIQKGRALLHEINRSELLDDINASFIRDDDRNELENEIRKAATHVKQFKGD